MAEPSLQDVTVHFGYVAEKHTQNMQTSELSTKYRDLDYYKRCQSKLKFDRMSNFLNVLSF